MPPLADSQASAISDSSSMTPLSATTTSRILSFPTLAQSSRFSRLMGSRASTSSALPEASSFSASAISSGTADSFIPTSFMFSCARRRASQLALHTRRRQAR